MHMTGPELRNEPYYIDLVDLFMETTFQTVPWREEDEVKLVSGRNFHPQLKKGSSNAHHIAGRLQTAP